MNPQEKVVEYIDMAIAELEKAKAAYFGEDPDGDAVSYSLENANKLIKTSIENVLINRRKNKRFIEIMEKL